MSEKEKVSKYGEAWQEPAEIWAIEEWRDHYAILLKNAVRFDAKKEYFGDIKPKTGDLVELCMYDKGSRHIRGFRLNGNVMYFATDQELDKWYSEDHIKQLKLDYQKYLKRTGNKDYKALPEYFKKIIDKIRKRGVAHDPVGEEYFVRCFKNAVIVADVLKTSKEVEAFFRGSAKEQKQLVPAFKTRGQTGMSLDITWNATTGLLRSRAAIRAASKLRQDRSRE